MDVFDRRILSVLRDGKAKYFEQVLSEAALSPSTLRQHPDQLIDRDLIEKLMALSKEYGLSPSGEGGEIETTVLDAPLFKKKIEVLDFKMEAKGNSGVFRIKQARLTEK